MDWTKDQQRVFDETNGNLLVSASAGCGKTAVMVERIFRYLEEGGSIKRLIVITFTRAAASEMKEKLTDTIYSHIRNGSKVADHLSIQAREIPFAFIGTIDGFCAEIYRRHFDDLGGDPNFTVIEEKEADSLFSEACDEIVIQKLRGEEAEVFSLLDSLSDKRSNDLFKSVMRDVYNFLSVRPDTDAFIEKVKTIIANGPDNSPAAEYLLRHFRKRAEVLGERFKIISTSSNTDYNTIFKAQIEDADICNELLSRIGLTNDIKTFTELITKWTYSIKALHHSKVKKLDDAAMSYYKNLIDWGHSIKKYYEHLKRLLTYPDATDHYAEFISREIESSNTHTLIIGLALEVAAIYRARKKEKSYLDFNDTERFALEILSDEKHAKSFAEEIDAVYLDEYQDTNYLQEAVINKIAKSNLFMVGDVKQSIYGFRSAEPEIFLNKKRLYIENPEEGYNLLLNGNFRSLPEILEYTNLLFDEIMTSDFGGVDYKEDARLEANPNAPAADQKFPVVTVKFFGKEEAPEREYPEIYSVKNDYPAQERLINIEGYYIAGQIEQTVGVMDIYDRKQKCFRKLKYSDIVILVRKKGIDVENIAIELERKHIPYNASGLTGRRGGMKDVQLLISYLHVIDNYMNDVPLYAVMSSFLGGFTTSELAEFRNLNKVDSSNLVEKESKFYWYAVKNYIGDPALMKKRDNFFEKISYFRELAQATSVPKLLDIILADRGFDGYLISRGGKERIGAVNSFVYSLRLTMRGRDLKDFLAVYDPNGDGQGEFDIPMSSLGEDCVTFYTVHKSKGLEFPFVFLAACNQITDRTSLGKKDVIFDDKLGMAFKWRNPDSRRKGETLTFRAIKLKKEISAKEELARLLYVATTRAESRLVVTAVVKQKKENESNDNVVDCSSFADLILFAESQNNDVKKYRDYSEIIDTDLSNQKKVDDNQEDYDGKEITPINITDEYAFKSAIDIACKYSVTRLNEEADDSYTKDYESDLCKNHSRDYMSIFNSDVIELGIAYHRYLEICDFKKNTEEEIKELIEKYSAEKKLVSHTRLDPAVLASALSNPIFKEVLDGTIYRENPFSLFLPACEILDTMCSDKILVQGTFDLLIIGDRNVLVDYKITSKREESIRRNYMVQMRMYALAVQKIFDIKLDEILILALGDTQSRVVKFDPQKLLQTPLKILSPISN
ncbi:MAG: UvrD-helicase domain-containing protein [Christensenellaceae bacterium]|jgi:ATP-dependent helicase/nuclease subunit A|nr:UvrD-helicase domain-containing protein [Christensenellaceae bacterium]